MRNGITSDENGWYGVLNAIMKIPGVKVKRREFLENEFKKYCEDEKIKILMEEGTGRAGISREIMDKVADNVIGFHGTMVIGTSFAAGLPGGFAFLGTIPVDVAQYYFHVLQVAQKIAYVYGYPDLDGGSDSEFLTMITIFVGVMSGVGAASGVIKTLADTFAKTTVKRLSAMALTKTTIYPIVKQIARVLGVRMTKAIFAKGVGKIIPLIGGVISGGLTAAVFSPSAFKLKDTLRENIIK
jgi:subtilisin family serine protease